MSFPKSGKSLPNGVLQLIAAPTSLSSTDVKKTGWASDKNGSLYKIDSPGAVPSTAIIRGGIAYNNKNGGMYTTTATPSATSQRFRGMVIRADGALHIDTVVSGSISFGQRRNSNGVWITT